MGVSKQRILITGANSGLGFETAKEVLKRGVGELVLACRTIEKAEHAKSLLMPLIPKGVNIVAVGGFDMTDPNSLVAAISDLSSELFDVVFLNAGGVVFSDDYQTVEWKGITYERTIFQNVFGGYLVYALLKESGRLSRYARIVFSGGEGARGIPGMIAMPQFGDESNLKDYLLGNFSNHPTYNPMNAIGVSKYIAALLTKSLHNDPNSSEQFIWFSPGFTAGTGGLSGLPKAQEWLMQNVVFSLLSLLGKVQSPAKGGKKNAACLMGEIGESGQLIASPQNKTLGRLVDQTPFNPEFSNIQLIATVNAVAVSLREAVVSQRIVKKV